MFESTKSALLSSPLRRKIHALSELSNPLVEREKAKARFVQDKAMVART